LRTTAHAPEWRGTRGPLKPGAETAGPLSCFLSNQLRSTLNFPRGLAGETGDGPAKAIQFPRDAKMRLRNPAFG
jgi:hypothetical protein